MAAEEVILLVTGVVTLAYLSPYVATALGLSFLRYTAIETASPKLPHLNSDDRRTRHRELVRAGYGLVGLVRERAFLFMDRIVLTTTVVKYRSPDGKVYVSLYSLPTDGRVRVAATSYGDDGSAVTAAMPGVGFEKRTDRTLRIEVRECPLSYLLQQHAEAVEDFDADGRPFRPLAVDLSEAAAREEAIEAEQIRGMGTGQVWFLFLTGWIVPAIGTAALLPLISPLDAVQIAAGATLVGCVTYPIFAWRILPKFLAFGEACPDFVAAESEPAERGERVRR